MKKYSTPVPPIDKKMAMMLALLVSVMPFSIDAYLPAIPAMAVGLNSDIHHIEQSMSTFVLGVALGQLIGGSLSDIKGRRVVALLGLMIFMLSTAALVMIQSVPQLLLLRLLQALGGGMATVVVGAVVRDRYDGREAARMFAMIGLITIAAPLLAPLIGALLLHVGGWRLIFACLCLYAALVWVILYRRLRVGTQPLRRFDRDFIPDIFRRYHNVFRQPQALGFLFLQALCFSSMFAFITESSFVYMELYHLSAQQYAWAFGCNIVTMAFFNRVTAWRLRTTDAQDILLWGIGIQLICNLLMFGAVWLFELPPFAFLLMLAMFAIGTQGLIAANTQACYMSYFKEGGGSANAVLGSFQFLMAAVIGTITTMLHNGTALVMSGMMLASTLTGIVLLWTFSRQAWWR
ncbi:MAG: multidrug effflux MFS transporter [Neisseria sp.]|nr:multidrug effflux MFS transporter [Neisseria sp.]